MTHERRRVDLRKNIQSIYSRFSSISRERDRLDSNREPFWWTTHVTLTYSVVSRVFRPRDASTETCGDRTYPS